MVMGAHRFVIRTPYEHGKKNRGDIKHLHTRLYNAHWHLKYNTRHPPPPRKKGKKFVDRKFILYFPEAALTYMTHRKTRKPRPVSNNRAAEKAVDNSCRRRRRGLRRSSGNSHTPNLHNPREKVMDSPHSSQHSINSALPSSVLGWVAGGG